MEKVFVMDMLMVIVNGMSLRDIEIGVRRVSVVEAFEFFDCSVCFEDDDFCVDIV